MVAINITSRLDRIEDELRKIRSEVTSKKLFGEMAGAWSDYRTEEGGGLEELKKEIYERRKGESRRFN
ncbi:MAG: hypothetical protein ABEJ03_02520 [Candidatus Nanohaloarchaea archaeon]